LLCFERIDETKSRSNMRASTAIAAALLVLAAAAAAPLASSAADTTANATANALPTFNASLIVPNISTDCPVPQQGYAEGRVTLNTLALAFMPLLSATPPGQCSAQASELPTCADDGSLAVRVGCCSTACAAKMRQASVALFERAVRVLLRGTILAHNKRTTSAQQQQRRK
jgi:hypothetical protein